MSKKSIGEPFPIPQRIRNRRESLGMAAYELAKRAGVSPSYLSLIEGGSKIPSETIAIRLAEALDDDPELYLAWVHASRHPNLTAHLDRMTRLENIRSSPAMRERVRRGDRLKDDDDGTSDRTGFARAADRVGRGRDRNRPTGGGDSAVQELAHNLLESNLPMLSMDSGADIVLDDPRQIEVPLLRDGADPGADPAESDGVVEVLHLDARLLPPGLDRPFAYRPGPAAIDRLQGVIRPGDIVVLGSDPETIRPYAIYAVRRGRRVVLSRVWQQGDTLQLLHAQDSSDVVTIPLRDTRGLPAVLAGVVVTTVRTWPEAISQDLRRHVIAATGLPKPRGRSVRLDGDTLVRDCQWRERYGWRPVQRPEDLEYLETHAGTRIRFRLIRKGRVRYLLEMDPEQWRTALGDYVEGPSWSRNGYIVAITKRRDGEYTDEFQDRWRPYVREADED